VQCIGYRGKLGGLMRLVQVQGRIRDSHQPVPPAGAGHRGAGDREGAGMPTIESLAAAAQLSSARRCRILDCCFRWTSAGTA
jgi:hypothetical protein